MRAKQRGALLLAVLFLAALLAGCVQEDAQSRAIQGFGEDAFSQQMGADWPGFALSCLYGLVADGEEEDVLRFIVDLDEDRASREDSAEIIWRTASFVLTPEVFSKVLEQAGFDDGRAFRLGFYVFTPKYLDAAGYDVAKGLELDGNYLFGMLKWQFSEGQREQAGTDDAFRTLSIAYLDMTEEGYALNEAFVDETEDKVEDGSSTPTGTSEVKFTPPPGFAAVEVEDSQAVGGYYSDPEKKSDDSIFYDAYQAGMQSARDFTPEGFADYMEGYCAGDEEMLKELRVLETGYVDVNGREAFRGVASYLEDGKTVYHMECLFVLPETGETWLFTYLDVTDGEPEMREAFDQSVQTIEFVIKE